MKLKIYFFIFAVLVVWGYFTKSFYDGMKKAEEENLRLNQELKTAVSESQIKAKAFAEREQSLINDRKELEYEYKKLLELKATDKHYSSWADAPLPDSVSLLL